MLVSGLCKLILARSLKAKISKPKNPEDIWLHARGLLFKWNDRNLGLKDFRSLLMNLSGSCLLPEMICRQAAPKTRHSCSLQAVITFILSSIPFLFCKPKDQPCKAWIIQWPGIVYHQCQSDFSSEWKQKVWPLKLGVVLGQVHLTDVSERNLRGFLYWHSWSWSFMCPFVMKSKHFLFVTPAPLEPRFRCMCECLCTDNNHKRLSWFAVVLYHYTCEHKHIYRGIIKGI